MAKREKDMAEFIRAMIRTTIAPTMVHGGIKENIIPSECEGVFDCRILPGQTKENLLNEVKEVLKDIENLEFEYIKANEPSESPFDTVLHRQVQETLRDFVPGCSVVPFMTTGGTDSRYLRRLASVCYGFQPSRTEASMDEMLKMTPRHRRAHISGEPCVGTSVLYRLVSSS